MQPAGIKARVDTMLKIDYKHDDCYGIGPIIVAAGFVSSTNNRVRPLAGSCGSSTTSSAGAYPQLHSNGRSYAINATARRRKASANASSNTNHNDPALHESAPAPLGLLTSLSFSLSDFFSGTSAGNARVGGGGGSGRWGVTSVGDGLDFGTGGGSRL